MLSGILYLTGQIRPRFLAFIKQFFPNYYESYNRLYKKGSADKEYKTKILISESTKNKLQGTYKVHFVGKIQLKGKSDLTGIYAITSDLSLWWGNKFNHREHREINCDEKRTNHREHREKSWLAVLHIYGTNFRQIYLKQ